MENYYTVLSIKQHLMNQPHIQGKIREQIKEALQVSNLLELHLKDNSSIALGEALLAMQESTMKKSLKEKGIEIKFPENLIIKENEIKEYKKFENKELFYKALNEKRKEKNPNIYLSKKEKKSANKEERKIKRTESGEKSLESYKKLLENDNIGLLFDIECNERKQVQILEIGYVKFNKNGEIEKRHLIIEEYYKIRNGKYVEDNKDNYDYGTSEKVSLEKALEIIKEEIEKSDFIVGHGIQNDIKFLKNNNVIISKEKPMINTLKMTKLLTKTATDLSIKNGLKAIGIEAKKPS